MTLGQYAGMFAIGFAVSELIIVMFILDKWTPRRDLVVTVLSGVAGLCVVGIFFVFIIATFVLVTGLF